MDLKPPAFPFPIDKARAARGEPLYRQHCASCHGRSGTDFAGEHVGKVTPINAEKLRTDRWRLDSYTHEVAASQNQLYAGYGNERFSHFRKTFGYANAPLDGLWLRAPYLHNGSVPTLRDLLEVSDQRPKIFFRGNDLYDPVRVGFVSAVASKPERSTQNNSPSLGRPYFRFDTQSLPGHQTAAFARVTAIDPNTRVVMLDRPLIRTVALTKIAGPDGAVLLWDIPVEKGSAHATSLTLEELPPQLAVGGGIDYSTPRERNEGNSNAGHEYGTDLTAEEKDSLVEFLKSF